MNPDKIVAIYVMVDDILKTLGHESDVRAQVSDAEVLTVAIVAASECENQQKRALSLMSQLGYLKHRLSESRFNRRLHQLSEWLALVADKVGELGRTREAFILDSMPLPVCRRCRARRCRKVSGLAYCGYCAAKKEKLYGYRLHLVCNVDGCPVSFTILPAFFDDRTPVPELLATLPAGASVAADKGYVSDPLRRAMHSAFNVDLIAARRTNMSPNTPTERAFIRRYRRRIETLYSQLEALGVQRLRARTVDGFLMKVYASLIAVACPLLN